MANSKTFLLTGGEYEFIDCTAVAVCAEDTERQNAVLIYQAGGDFSRLFGCTVNDLPTSPEEMERFLIGESTISDWEDLKTVLIDGKPLDDFVWG